MENNHIKDLSIKHGGFPYSCVSLLRFCRNGYPKWIFQHAINPTTCKENDETLYEHRKGNSAKLLFLKALLSQSVPALVLCSASVNMDFWGNVTAC